MTRIDFDDDYLSPEQKRGLSAYNTQFDELVGKLRLAAIDARMRDHGYIKKTEQVYARESYWFAPWLEGTIQIDRVERPGPDGRGGGTHYQDGHRSGTQYEQEFNGICATLDSWIDRFRGLPDPNAFTSVIDAMVNVGTSIAVGANGEGLLDDLLDEIEAGASLLHGIAADTYKLNFINQFDVVLENHYSLAALLTQYLVAQKAMWEAARGDYVTIVRDATAAFCAAAERQSAPGSFKSTTLKVLTVVADAVQLITAPTTKAIEWANLALDATDDLIPDSAPADSRYEAVMRRTLDLFEKLDLQIKAVEDQIYEKSGLNMDRISGATTQENSGSGNPHQNRDTVRANFRLVPQYLDPSMLSPSHISADRDVVQGILKRMLGGADGYGVDVIGVVPTLTTVLNMVPSPDQFVAPAIRDHDVGRGHYGPMLALNELLDMFADLLKNLRDSVQLSADNFQVAYDVLFAANDQTGVTLQTVLAGFDALQSPSGYDDPWRYDKTPAPNESFREQYLKLNSES